MIEQIDFKNMPPTTQFLFMAMMKSAMLVKQMEKDKSFFVGFAEEIWNSMEMSDFEALKEIINDQMRKDIEPYVHKYMKSMKSKD